MDDSACSGGANGSFEGTKAREEFGATFEVLLLVQVLHFQCLGLFLADRQQLSHHSRIQMMKDAC